VRSSPRGRRSLGLAAAAFALFATLVPSSALADARTEARRHFKTGMELIAKKKYVEGIQELEKANEILPHPNVMFNIARAHAELGNLEQAIASYKEYIASDPPDREKVSGILKELEDKLATQRAWNAAEKAQTQPQKPGEAGGDKPGETVKPGETPGGATPDKPGEVTGKITDAQQGAAGGQDKKPPPGTLNAAETEAIVGAARTEDVYQETVVTASRGAQSPLDSPNSTTIITRQDIRLSGITRIPELLRRVAGMDVMQITGGDTNVSMRGFNSRLSNKLLVLVDGRFVQNDFLGSTFWESLSVDVDQIERIEIVRGPGSALYGANAFAGIVNIITVAPGAGRSGVRVGYGDHNQMYGSGWASARSGDFAYRASAGFTRYPRWTREVGRGRVDIQPTEADQNVGAQNARIDIRASQRISQTKEILIGGGFASSDIDMYGIGPFNDYALHLDNSDVTAQFRSENFNAKAYYLRVSSHASANSAHIGRDLYYTEPVQNSVGVEFEYVNNFTFPQALKHEIHIGASYRLKDISWSYLADDFPTENHGAAFLQDSIKIGNYVTAVLSGRLDYVPYLQRVVPSPRGSVIIKPTDRQAVRLSSSTAFRSTTFLESYLDLPIQLQLPGAELVSASRRQEDPSFILGPEQIVTVEASYLNQQSDLFEFELTGYYNRITDLIVLASPRPVTLSNKADGIGGLNPDSGQYTVAFGGWTNQCDVYNVVGGELGGRVYPLEGLDIFANYAINYSTQSRPDGCNVPEDNRTSRHKLNAGVQVRTPVGIDGEVTFHYQSAQAWNEQVATLTGIEYQTFNLPGYSLLNARVGYRFYKNRAEVSATVFNALAGIGNDGEAPQHHPFGNRVGRRFMGFFSYSL
jgi:iron complex outermembrane receptor protein